MTLHIPPLFRLLHRRLLLRVVSRRCHGHKPATLNRIAALATTMHRNSMIRRYGDRFLHLAESAAMSGNLVIRPKSS